MKLRHCDWVPLSVANWLCEELDERGIPGNTYSHTLLSLLHPYFCPHPVPKDLNHFSKCLVQSESLRSILESNQAKEFEILLEELEYVHPDADFPDLDSSTEQSKKISKTKKFHERKLQELLNIPEKLWKEAACQYLSTASEESNALEVIVEKLFEKLKDIKEQTFPMELDNSVLTETGELHSDRKLKDDLLEKTSIYSPSDLNTLHSFDFPPLDTIPTEISSRNDALNFKSLIREQFSPEKQDSNPFQNSKLDEPENAEKQNLNFEYFAVDKVVRKPKMEISSNQFGENPQMDLKSSHFFPIETPNSTTNYLLTDKGYQDVLDDRHNQELQSSRTNLEGWECADVAATPKANKEYTIDKQGGRLFERTIVEPIDFATSNMMLELEEDRIKKTMEQTISHSVAQLWGYNNTDSNSQVGNVWGSKGTDHEKFLKSSLFHDCHSDNLNSLSFNNQEWGQRPEMKNSSGDGGLSESSSALHLSRGRETKDIWSDLNDNNISSGTVGENLSLNLSSESGVNIALPKGDSEDKLCESFRSLGLEHLWEDPLVNSDRDSHEPNNFSLMSTFVENRQVDIFSAEEINRMNQKFDQLDPYFMSIPSGPNGPYVELKHTESSGFSTVVPHKSVEDDMIHEELLLMTSKGEKFQDSKHEEENLLTSPRTHFRPIRQDSYGGNRDENKPNECRVVRNVIGEMQDPDLVFQRSASGNLFLENDVLKGSPKKYMVYRDSSVKPIIDATSEKNIPQHFVTSQSTSLIPKFKVIENEKYCQTEEKSNVSCDNDRELLNSLKKTDASAIWKSDQVNNLKNLWPKSTVNIPLEKEAWEIDNSVSLLPKWSTNDLNSTHWNQNTALPPSCESLLDNSALPPSCESLLDNSALPPSCESLLDNSALPPSCESLPGNSTLPPSCESLLDNSALKGLNNIVPEMKTKTDDYSLSKFKFLWHDSMEQTSIKSSTVDSRTKGKLISSSLEKPIFDVQKSSLTATSTPWIPDMVLHAEADQPVVSEQTTMDNNNHWRLQWELDQELGENSNDPLANFSVKESPSNVTAMSDQENLNFYCNFEGRQVEDLENLEPGWDLNEGFEWGPAADNENDEEREVLVYENEEGQTVMVPVEYIDDSLYDEIFGSDTNIPIGGSLPDLPQGQMAEWKKLSRRSKATRFLHPSRRPCSFFLEGNCRRSDCKFSHDLLGITCRFWEEGSCLKGDTCPFRHGAAPPPPRRRNRSEGDQASLLDSFNLSLKDGANPAPGVSKSRPIPKKSRGSFVPMSSYEINSETDFPCLGSSVESKTGSLEDTSTLGAAMKAALLGTKKKKKCIGVVTTAELADCDMKMGKTRSDRKKSKGGKLATGEDAAHKKKKEKGDCESLRKILRKRHAAIGHQSPNRHEDGTVSDF